MNSITARLRRFVVERAGRRCEYCGLAQEDQKRLFTSTILCRVAQMGEPPLKTSRWLESRLRCLQ